jgi:hypothetical protein
MVYPMANYLIVINLGYARVPMIETADDRSTPDNSQRFGVLLRRLAER